MIFFLVLLNLCMFSWVSCEKEPDVGPAPAPLLQAEKLPSEFITLGEQEFVVELAFTRESRARGLMFREHLPDNAGMLFIFDRSELLSFYMKNCLIDLDVLFIGSDGSISSIRTMKVPVPGRPLRFYESDIPVKYALELPAGTAKRLGLQTGQKIRFPTRIQKITAEPN